MGRARIHALGMGLIAAGCSGIDHTTAPGQYAYGGAMPTETAISSPRLANALAHVVATVATSSGGITQFLDLGNGDIAIGERAPRGAQFVALPLIARYDATALEVYLAIQPDGVSVPALLVRDHESRVHRSAARAANPRDFDAPGITMADLQTPGLEPYACDSFGTDWVNDWIDAFNGLTKYRAAIYRHQQTGTYTFYPGADVYYGTNTNSKTYLGACNGDAYDDLSLEIHRRISGSWVKVHEVSIDSYEKYTFYSPIPASYRGRAQGAGGSTVEHYGVAAAWTISPGLAPVPRP